MAYFKDIPGIGTVAMASATPIAPIPAGGAKRTMALNYNRIGGLLSTLCANAGISLEAALAVWQAESGSLGYQQNKTVLRFENHKFYKHWGQNNTAVFDQHFQFGGRNGIAGKSWENHKWRQNAAGAWERFHGDQDDEYAVFNYATGLATQDAACLSSSFGGCQILGSNHQACGYGSASALFTAFNQDERWEVCGFFDFCKTNNAIDELKNHAWEDFAEIYNGAGNAKVYGKIIEDNYHIAKALLANLPAAAANPAANPAAPAAIPAAPAPAAGSQAQLVAFIAGLGLRNFKPYELLTMGAQHSNPSSSAYGLNTLPPHSLWPNIVPTIRLLDDLRDMLNAAIVIHSAYRSPAYNTAISGAAHSQHVDFRAIDFVVRSPSSPADWANALRQMRTAGAFTGGIGTYPTFVHVDTRGANADW